MSRRRSATRDRLLAGVMATAAHLGVLVAVLNGRSSTPTPVEPDWTPIPVVLVDPAPPPPPPPPPPPAPAKPETPAPKPPAPAKPRPTPVRAKPPPPADVVPLRIPAAPKPKPQPAFVLSEAELAGAATAGSGDGGDGAGSGGGGGDGGGSCDMVRRLQAALRRDPQIRAAVAQARDDGRAILVWNGDWIRSGAEDGKGLAGVRQAIMVEVAFAPKACRAAPMRGLVLISMGDGARLVLGSAQWRWSDLLFVR